MNDQFLKNLSLQVTEQVLGWVPSVDGVYWKDDEARVRGVRSTAGVEWAAPPDIWSPATNIAHAMEVVADLSCWGFAAFHYSSLSSAGFGWVVAFGRSLRPYSLELVTLGDPDKIKHAHSNSLPEAICLAALKTLEPPRGAQT